MSSKSTPSEFSSTASAPGTNFGKNSSTTNEDEVLTADGDNGNGEEPVVKTGNGDLGVCSENRQAIQSLLVSQQKRKPNKNVRALVIGDVGRVIGSLIDLHETPGASEAMFTMSLLA